MTLPAHWLWETLLIRSALNLTIIHYLAWGAIRSATLPDIGLKLTSELTGGRPIETTNFTRRMTVQAMAEIPQLG